MKAITEPWKGREHGPSVWASREAAEEQAAYWRAHPVEARADDWSFQTTVSDPPPLDLQHKGRTYFLAHFNAHRAVYSAEPQQES